MQLKALNITTYPCLDYSTEWSFHLQTVIHDAPEAFEKTSADIQENVTSQPFLCCFNVSYMNL
jgi:hypothetical protein